MTTTTPSPYGSLAFHSLSSVVCGGGSDDYCSVVADEYSMQRRASVDGDADERKIVVNSFAAASKRRVCCIRQDIKFQQRSRYRRFIGRDEAMSMHNIRSVDIDVSEEVDLGDARSY
eukprot:scaffold7119_cov119-Skeletonema_marinoi.AAC.6